MSDTLTKADQWNLAATYMAAGMGTANIAAALQVSVDTVRRWRADPEFRAQHLEPLMGAMRAEVLDRWRLAAGKAFAVIEEHLQDDSNPKLQSKTAMYVLDRFNLDPSGAAGERQSGSAARPITLNLGDALIEAKRRRGQ